MPSNTWNAKISQEIACRSNESKDNAFPDHDDDDWIDGSVRLSQGNHEEREREVALQSMTPPSGTLCPTEQARGRHGHVSRSGRRPERYCSRPHGIQPPAEGPASSHDGHRIHRDLEFPPSTTASTSTSPSTPDSEKERDGDSDVGYESSPSDYSEIWNDYRSSSEDEDDGGADQDQDQEKKCEYEERQRTYDRLCADPPQRPPSLASIAERYGDHSSWNAHACILPCDFDDDSLLGGRDMIGAFEPKDPRL